MIYRRSTFVVLAIGTVLTMASFSWIDKPLKGLTNGNNLQHIKDPDEVRKAIAVWKSPDGRDVTAYAFAGVAVDTVLFIPLYSLLLFAGISRLPGRWRWLAALALIAGAADLAENLGILIEIEH